MNNNKLNQPFSFSKKQYDADSINYRVRAPLYERLIQYAQSGDRSYHVPGHKNGAAYGLPIQHSAKALSMEYMRELLRLDVTEIEGTDDLHHPEGVIQEGQELAARCFGAEETYWLVGGSTSGNLALLLSVCQQPGDLIIVQRNVHKSVIHGLMLAGAQAVFLTPEIDKRSGLAVVPSTKTVQQALERYPHARAVLLTSPNYYGMGSDLSAIAGYCHEQGIPLLVDEAHGAHYGHHPRFPQSALSAGADGVVQSTHKMLSAMTMGAMLHVQGELLDRELVQQRLTMIQSSSPSYPIMASLDLSRYWLDVVGSDLFQQGLAARDYVVEHIASIGSHFPSLDKGTGWNEQMDGNSDYSAIGAIDAIGVVNEIRARGRFAIVNEECTESSMSVRTDSLDTHKEDFKDEVLLDESRHDPLDEQIDRKTNKTIDQKVVQKINQDPFKVVLYDRTGYLSGQQLQQQLERYGCIPEMSDERYVVLVFSLGSQIEDATRLLDALRSVAADTAVDAYEHVQSNNLSRSERIQTSVIWSESQWDVVDSASPVSSRLEKMEPSQTVSLVSEPVSFQLKPVAQQQIESIPLEQAAGRVCAEMVIPYPPGIPVLYAGETISAEVQTRLLQVRKHGMKIQGAADASLESIRVYRGDIHRATEPDVS